MAAAVFTLLLGSLENFNGVHSLEKLYGLAMFDVISDRLVT